MELTALYYDGRTSSSCEVRLVFYEDGSVAVLGEGVSLRFRISELVVASRLGNTPRAVALPNGGKCEIADNDQLDAVLSRWGRTGNEHWIHRLESSLLYVLVAVLVTAGFSWGMVTHGIPALAEQAAYALPESIDRKLGQGTLEVLDRSLFEASGLDSEHRERLLARFNTMTAALDSGQDYRLEFRKGGDVGANAFALPSGIVIMTDELVELSEHDDEVIAVLAHEIGHLEYRHSLRMVMQDSALALVISVITGDPFSTSALAVALPTVLVHASYSREFETEADDYAYDYLTANNIPTEAFASILLRINEGRETSDMERYLSTHPGTRERVLRFQQQTPPVSP